MDVPKFPGVGVPSGTPARTVHPSQLPSDLSLMNLKPVDKTDNVLLQFLQANYTPKHNPTPVAIQLPSPPKPATPVMTFQSQQFTSPLAFQAGSPFQHPNPTSQLSLADLQAPPNQKFMIPAGQTRQNQDDEEPEQPRREQRLTAQKISPPPPAVQPSTSAKPDSWNSILAGDFSRKTNLESLPPETNDLDGLSESQARAIQSVMSGKNILLTGPAGTGKSHTIKRIREIYDRRRLKIGVTSTTGASAILIEGKTIHSWAGIGISGTKEGALKQVMTYKAPQERIKSTVLLIIDEVSMLAANVLDILDYVFRLIRNDQRPFGGLQILLCGDFYQLSPVKAAFAFESPNWNTLVQEVHELTYIYRQSSVEFCTALNEIRIGEISHKTVELFTQCLGREFTGEIKPTELYPTNDDVSSVNEDELWKLASETNMIREKPCLDQLIEKTGNRRRGQKSKSEDPKFIFECKERMNKECVAPELLQTAVGAQVMLLKNLNVDAGLANGSRGVVVGYGPYDEPIVKFLNGQVMQMQTAMWYMRINETIKIRRTQYPIKLAFAISVHKSQGMSIDLVKADLGSRTFAEGQFYTAMSRVRSLEGLSLIAIDWNKVLTSKKVKEFYLKNKLTK